MISLFCACGETEPQDLISTLSNVNTEGEQVRKYLDKKIFLDVDVQALLQQAAGTSSRSSDNTDDLCRMKAALHRFYSHVKIEGGKYECSLKNAQEINISETLFSILKKNLEEGNAWIEKCRKEGKKIVFPEISDEYLNSLLE